MESELPENVSTGRVIGLFIASIGSVTVPLTGKLRFTASAKVLPDPTAAEPVTILPIPTWAILNAGEVYTPMADGSTPLLSGIRLIATDDPDVSQVEWTWTVEFFLDPVGGVTPTIETKSFQVPSNMTIDLVNVVTEPESSGRTVDQTVVLVSAAQAYAAQALSASNSAQGYIDELNAEIEAFEILKGTANGVATLDGNAKVPVSQIPTGLPSTDQYDYVAALALKSKSTKMQIKKNTSTNEIEVSCLTPSGKHVTYQFYGSTGRDDYRILANIWGGTSTAIMGQTIVKGYPDLAITGLNWTTAAGAFSYTTDKTTPATFTTTVTVDSDGSDIRMHTYRNNQGGVWEIKLAGPVSSTTNVSTWASAAAYAYGTYTTVGTNLRAGTYTITGKFLGDDPLNPPTGGTSRGWLANNGVFPITSSTSSSILFDVYSPFRAISKDILLKPDSNMDIAMEVKPVGGTTLEYMPYHAVATMFQLDAPVYLDGDSTIDLSTMFVGTYRSVSSFELVQRVNGRNTTSGTTDLVVLATSQLIRPNGMVSVTGSWVPLTNIALGNNYNLMLPASMALFDKLVTSIGNAYRNGTDLIGTQTNLVAENDIAMSYMFLSSTNKNIACAVRYNNMPETIRRGKANKNPDATKAFLQHRDASITKVYNRPYAAGTVIPAGTVHRFSGDYIYAQGIGLYDQFAI